MQLTTRAIVLSSIKYSDTSLIVKCFTVDSGVKSYLLKGILKSRKGKLKAAYFQPLTQLEITATHNTKGALNTIKEAHVFYAYVSLHSNYIKQALSFFIAEMLSNAIQEEETNEPLFQYLESSLQWLDLHEKVANFHLVFLMNLTKYLGIYPDLSNENSEYFDLDEGLFSNTSATTNNLQGSNLLLFKKILGINFDECTQLEFSVTERKRLLEIIIFYYQTHLVGFRKPKTVQVLTELFN